MPDTKEADRAPNWETWRLMPRPALWQCVALSLNIDPYKLKRDAFCFPERVSDQFRNRIDVTCATLRERHPADCAPIAERSPLSLRKFAAWAREFVWDAPIELLAMADEHDPGEQKMPTTAEGRPQGDADDPKWPWGSHDTKLLRHLAAAADRFWKNYDPSDPTTAPKNQEVTDWLKKQGVAHRNAQIMATILRANDLRTGPRT